LITFANYSIQLRLRKKTLTEYETGYYDIIRQRDNIARSSGRNRIKTDRSTNIGGVAMRISLDKRLYMDCPDGFRRLTEEELQKMNLVAGGKGLCISDPNRHIVITVTWTQGNVLTSWLMGTREAAGSMARHIGKSMKKFNYVWLDDVKRTVDGQTARGIDYEYVVNGINMTGESLVIKMEENIFYFHMYARKARRAESLAVFHEILDGVAIVE
jgi:hypothetical protein